MKTKLFTLLTILICITACKKELTYPSPEEAIKRQWIIVESYFDMPHQSSMIGRSIEFNDTTVRLNLRTIEQNYQGVNHYFKYKIEGKTILIQTTDSIWHKIFQFEITYPDGNLIPYLDMLQYLPNDEFCSTCWVNCEVSYYYDYEMNP